MKFEETKYNLGDKVWLFKRDVKEYRCPCCGGSKHRTTKVYVVQGVVDYICCWVDNYHGGHEIHVTYGHEDREITDVCFDSECYDTEKEAIKGLKEWRIKNAKREAKEKKACQKACGLGRP